MVTVKSPCCLVTVHLTFANSSHSSFWIKLMHSSISHLPCTASSTGCICRSSLPQRDFFYRILGAKMRRCFLIELQGCSILPQMHPISLFICLSLLVRTSSTSSSGAKASAKRNATEKQHLDDLNLATRLSQAFRGEELKGTSIPSVPKGSIVPFKF